MAHYILKRLMLLFLIMAAAPFCAKGADGSAPGFSGSLQGGAYYLQTDSRLYTEDENRRINDLDGPADTHAETAGLAAIDLRYQFAGGTALYAGNPLEIGEDLVVAAGLSQPVAGSRLDLAATWLPASSVWKNPYQTVDSRIKTDAEAYGLRVQLQEIGGSSWEVSGSSDRIEIKDDEIGELINDLKRSGWTHEIGVKYTLPLQEGIGFSPELSYACGDFEGHSNRYHEIKLGLQLQAARPPWVLTGLVSGFHRQYQKVHPLFHKTRQEAGIFTFAQVMRLNLFGMEPLFASAGAGYVFTDADIDFYDSRTFIAIASVGLEF